MRPDIKTTPPAWCKDAVPSDRGWRHPKTGELLIAVKGGCYRESDEIIDENVSVPVIDESSKSEDLINEEPTSTAVIEETPDEKVIDETPKQTNNKKKTGRRTK